MPSINPLIDQDAPEADPAGQSTRAHIAPDVIGLLMNPQGATQATAANAAGTAENVAMHVAFIIACALVGIYVLKQSGFKFVVAAGVGS